MNIKFDSRSFVQQAISFQIGMQFDKIYHVYLLLFLDRTESASALIDDNRLGGGDDDDNDVGRGDTKQANLLLPGSEATQHRWKKCAALKESQTDITTQEEFYKFDFQVMSNQ